MSSTNRNPELSTIAQIALCIILVYLTAVLITVSCVAGLLTILWYAIEPLIANFHSDPLAPLPVPLVYTLCWCVVVIYTQIRYRPVSIALR